MEPTTTGKASVDAELQKLEQATNEQLAGEVNTNTETVEEEKPTTEEPKVAPEEGQALKELMEKKGFKSAEDLARAYKALESRSTKTDQERRGLEEQLAHIQAIKESGNTTSEQDQALQVLEASIEKVLAKRLRPIEDSIGVSKVDKMIQDFQSVEPDFKGAIVDEVLDYMVDHKGVSMEDAYKIKAFDKVRTSSVQRETVEQKKQAASRAFTESAATAKSGKDVDYSKLSLQELEDILPAAGQFVDSRGKLRQG